MKSAFTTLFIFIATFGLTQSSTDFQNTIIGNWNGKGTLFGTQASFSMEWGQVLNKKFIKLVFENKFEDQSGVERVMNAHAYYDLTSMKGQWFDSRGMILPLRLEINDNMMTVFWGSDNTEQGKTVYSILDGEKMNVQDYVLRNENYQAFGEAQYEKIKE
jgi:hypothetical protein